MSSSNEAFQALKPPAVALSQATLQLVGNHSDNNTITARLRELENVVLRVSSVGNLDAKLAEYVFFPISQVLKLSKQISLESFELSLQVIAVLVKDGWKSKIEYQLAQQLLILCTISASDTPTLLGSTKTSSELQKNALICIRNVYDAISSSPSASQYTQDAQIPQLGQTISTVLAALQKSSDINVQTAAVEALRSIVNQLLRSDIQSRFLPGIVSALTKVLTPSTEHRRPASILLICLDLLANLFRASFGDSPQGASADNQENNGQISSIQGHNGRQDTITEAARQIRLALSNIVRLQTHNRHDVREALAKFCITILRDCAKSLANCIQLALETLVTLCSDGQPKLRFELSMLITSRPAISKLLQEAIHNWSQSLVRIMQSSDDTLKSRRLSQIGMAYSCIAETNIDLTWCDRELGQSLVDSIILTLQNNKQTNKPAQIESMQSVDLSMSAAKSQNLGFSEMAESTTQKQTLRQIAILATTITSTNDSSLFTSNLTRKLPYLQGDEFSAHMWLLTAISRAKMEKTKDMDSMLDFASTTAVTQSTLEEVYPTALSLLADATEHNTDSTQLSLALHMLALRAQEVGTEFRFELIDALYPVLHTMATPNAHLQQDSIAALNIITSACEYKSVTELIVENVDYLTNAVALQLNSFNVSPQAPQVLLMMVRLAGPALLPFLEDTIESIFAALEDYHGYPLLVELLFKTLAVVAEEGAKTPLLIADSSTMSIHTGVELWKPITASDLAARLRERVDEESQLKREQDESGREPAPQEPWSTKDLNNEQQDTSDAAVQPPAPKSYALLHKITELTQHYLPSSSPSLRLSLLSLIRTTVPSIARHEDSFLPLINTLWPEIVARLEDDETVIQASAIESITCLCTHAKSFMRSRINKLWPLIEKMWRGVNKELSHSSVTPSANLLLSEAATTKSFAMVRQNNQMNSSFLQGSSNTAATNLRQALLDLVVVIVRCVPLDADRFDAALLMVDTRLNDASVMDAFEQENADAVWLARVKKGLVEMPAKPVFMTDNDQILIHANG